MLGGGSMRRPKQPGPTDLCMTCASDGIMRLWDLRCVGGKGGGASVRFNWLAVPLAHHGPLCGALQMTDPLC